AVGPRVSVDDGSLDDGTNDVWPGGLCGRRVRWRGADRRPGRREFPGSVYFARGAYRAVAGRRLATDGSAALRSRPRIFEDARPAPLLRRRCADRPAHL